MPQAENGAYSQPDLPPGENGGVGSQLFSFTPIAPGQATITFVYK